MNDFPEELLENAFLQLTAPYQVFFTTDTCTLAKVCLVSKLWNRIGTPLLYQSLEVYFDDSSFKTNSKQLTQSLKSKKERLPQIKALRARCNGRSCGEDSPVFGSDQEVNHEELLSTIISRASNLERLDIKGFMCSFHLPWVLFTPKSQLWRRLRRLDIGVATHDNKHIPYQMIFNLPQLETLSLCNGTAYGILLHEKWDENTSSVRHLSLCDLPEGAVESYDKALTSMSRACVALSSLHLVIPHGTPGGRKAYTQVADSFRKHFKSGTLKRFEISQRGPLNMFLTGASIPLSLFEHLEESHRPKFNIEYLRLDLHCVFNKFGIGKLEYLPGSLHHLTLRCQQDQMIFVRASPHPPKESRPLYQMYKNAVALNSVFRTKFPFLQSINIETDLVSTSTMAFVTPEVRQKLEETIVKLRKFLATHKVQLNVVEFGDEPCRR